MDRFKFRAWDKEAEKMISFESLKNMTSLVGNEAVTRKGVFYPFLMEELEFMQCVDRKSKGGNLIYEGDIVSWRQFCTGVVVFSCCGFFIEWDSEGFGREIYAWLGELEIIGNIYENPGLLEEIERKRKIGGACE